MKQAKQKLISEQTSPLFRVYDACDRSKVNSFHIGNGYILSVAHYSHERVPISGRLFLYVQFRNNQFFANPTVTSQINPMYIFPEPNLKRYTFLLELEVSKEFLEHDIVIYRLKNVSDDIIRILPSIEVDYNTYDDDSTNIFCLQSSPSGSGGRLLNRVKIEGILDYLAISYGNHTVDGLRYLISGYFQFGSSGAPYVRYDDESNEFKVIAIQSEACPLQLKINNSTIFNM